MTSETLSFIWRRLLQVIPVVIGIACLNFLILQLAPGDVVDVLAGDAGGSSPEYMAELRRSFGLDQAVYIQFYRYLSNLVQFNLGFSFRQNMPVLELVMGRLPATILLMVAALVIALGVGCALGVLAASRVRTAVDNLISVFVLLTHAMPTFWFGLMAIVLFSAKLGWLPSGGMISLDKQYTGWAHIRDVAAHLILPALTLSTFYLAMYTRLTRAAMLELYGADFVRTARAKGASESRVVLVHALRNALLPMVTMLGLQVAAMLSGAVLVESVFGWPGLGRLAFEAIIARDLNLLLGILFLSAILVTLINVLVDIVYRLLDPRVELGNRQT